MSDLQGNPRLSRVCPADLLDELLYRAESNLKYATTDFQRNLSETQIQDLNLYKLHWWQNLARGGYT